MGSLFLKIDKFPSDKKPDHPCYRRCGIKISVINVRVRFAMFSYGVRKNRNVTD